MAIVHDLLAGSDEERVDFAEAARTVVDLVRRGLIGDESRIVVSVSGTTGLVDARTATSLSRWRSPSSCTTRSNTPSRLASKAPWTLP